MDENGKITISDIQGLEITKKFVSIDSSKYAIDAFNMILGLVDSERAILFDKATNRIYTLGDYYGGDTLKENLHYFSKVLNINDEGEIISSFESLKNEDSITFYGTQGIDIEFKDNNVIKLSLKLNDIIEEYKGNKTKDTEYYININNNNKLEINKQEPFSINIDDVSIKYNRLDNVLVEIPFTVSDSSNVDDLEKFKVIVENGTLENVDSENNKIKVMTMNKSLDPKITIEYSNGIIDDTKTIYVHWSFECYYGIYDGYFNEYGKFYINNVEQFNNDITIRQGSQEYAYILCPSFFEPIFIDIKRNIQGAWHKIKMTETKNGLLYNIYLTDNENLGTNNWHITNK